MKILIRLLIITIVFIVTFNLNIVSFADSIDNLGNFIQTSNTNSLKILSITDEIPVVFTIDTVVKRIDNTGSITIYATASGKYGIKSITVDYFSPSRNCIKSINLIYNVTNKDFEGNIQIDSTDEGGKWIISKVIVVDNELNTRRYLNNEIYNSDNIRYSTDVLCNLSWMDFIVFNKNYCFDIRFSKTSIDMSLTNGSKEITRAELCRFLVQSFGLEDETAVSNFTDVSVDNEYYHDISAAYKAGLAYGHFDGSFMPNELVLRSEYAKLLTYALGWTYIDILNETSQISDVPSTHWAYPYISAVTNAGLMNVYSDGSFKPQDNLVLDINKQLIPIIIYSNTTASEKSVTWVIVSSSAPNVVSISSTGLVTALNSGTAVIRATNNTDNSKYAECTVMVTDDSTVSNKDGVVIGTGVDADGLTVTLNSGGMVTRYKIDIDVDNIIYHNINFGIYVNCSLSNGKITSFNTVGNYVYNRGVYNDEKCYIYRLMEVDNSNKIFRVKKIGNSYLEYGENINFIYSENIEVYDVTDKDNLIGKKAISDLSIGDYIWIDTSQIETPINTILKLNKRYLKGGINIANMAVSLNKVTTTILKGQSEQLIAHITPTEATDKTVSWSVYSSSESNVVTVSSTGQVNAINIGTAIVRATSNSNSSTYADCIVTVTTSSATTIDECFIATAAFGSKFEPSVKLLRKFRDEYLLTNNWGKKFVKFYYSNSPPIANKIRENEISKGITRVLLTPIIILVYMIFHPILIILIIIFCIWKKYSNILLIRFSK